MLTGPETQIKNIHLHTSIHVIQFDILQKWHAAAMLIMWQTLVLFAFLFLDHIIGGAGTVLPGTKSWNLRPFRAAVWLPHCFSSWYFKVSLQISSYRGVLHHCITTFTFISISVIITAVTVAPLLPAQTLYCPWPTFVSFLPKSWPTEVWIYRSTYYITGFDEHVTGLDLVCGKNSHTHTHTVWHLYFIL